jgi:hypothetical protein
MPEKHQGPAFYRAQSKTLREIAANAPTGEHQDRLLNIALDYERLADNVEKRQR